MCGHLTKYTRLICWTAKSEANGGPSYIFEPTLLVLLELMQDQVKKVCMTYKELRAHTHKRNN